MDRAIRLVVVPGVFRPRSDSWMLTESLRDASPGAGAEVLDLCTGSGVAAISAARLGANATAVDVSRRAVVTVRLNAAINRVAGRVQVVRGDLFDAVPGRSFDVIVSNPPYVPSGDGDLPARGPSRAWEGGPDGRVVLDRICDEAPRRLRPGGTVLLVHSSLCGTETTLERLADGGLDVRVAQRRTGPLGPLMLARAADLERRGVLAPGQREEDVVVIEGRRPIEGS
ncbi:MAG TPA: HemK2/MTQ2 family protein methyltransferase [Thermoleophilaceae bacterium]|nr:HemK2/MTQ2 family protein methyltransferase [Thermoleophilaceae bacterium]